MAFKVDLTLAADPATAPSLFIGICSGAVTVIAFAIWSASAA